MRYRLPIRPVPNSVRNMIEAGCPILAKGMKGFTRIKQGAAIERNAIGEPLDYEQISSRKLDCFYGADAAYRQTSDKELTVAIVSLQKKGFTGRFYRSVDSDGVRVHHDSKICG